VNQRGRPTDELAPLLGHEQLRAALGKKGARRQLVRDRRVERRNPIVPGPAERARREKAIERAGVERDDAHLSNSRPG
jgi:hypothetical protein